MASGKRVVVQVLVAFVLVVVGFTGGFMAGIFQYGRISEAREFARSRFAARYLCREAPEIASTTVDGAPWRIADRKGKVVVLDFWATWCGPCIAALPELKRIHQRYGARPDFELVGMSLDVSPKDVEMFCEENGIDWTQLVDPGKDFDSAAAQALHVTAIPSVWVIDREGRIAGVKVGYGQLEGLLASMLGP